MVDNINKDIDYNLLQRRIIESVEGLQRGINTRSAIKKGLYTKLPEDEFKHWKKFFGDVACRVVQFYLNEYIINKDKSEVVGPNAFINNLPIEIDLLIVKKGAKPMRFTNMYGADQVLAAIEIKTSGVFDNGAIEKQAETFDSIKKIFPKIDCIYISLQENEPKKPESFNLVKTTKTLLNRRGYGAFIFKNIRNDEYFDGELEQLVKRIKALNW